MRKFTLFTLAVALLAVPDARAGNVGVNLNINVGNPAPVVIAPAGVPVVVTEPPLFLVPPALGFSVAVGVPYDMFHIEGRYYLHRDNRWYRSHRYDGPWTVVVRDRLPPGLRKHRYEKIILVRDEEYHHYRRDRDHYKGRHYRPERHERHDRHDDRHAKRDRGRGHDDDHGRGKGHKGRGHD